MRKMMRDKVQEYFDGELTGDERARFEAELTADDRERLAALGEMRALLNHALDADAGEVDIWSGVSKQLGQKQPQVGQASGARRGATKRRRYFGGAGVFLAAAAALVLFVRPWHPRHPSDNCDVEDLEFHGGYASVIELDDVPHKGDTNATLIWTDDDEEMN
jgi:anti-sigma factor RsiW